MDTFREILARDFLLRDALVASVLVGVVCPLVGAYFVLRRMIFLGVALPQLSAAGIAFAFLIFSSFTAGHAHGERPERLLSLAGSLGFTLAGLVVLAALERRGRRTVEARIGAVYVLAAAATLLFVAVDPLGESQMTSLLKGDIVTTSRGGLGLLVTGFTFVLGLLVVFRKEFLLVSFDRDMAVVLGLRAGLLDALLYLAIGTTISFGVMTAGPLVTFGFLVIPPLAARQITTQMRTFALASALLGGSLSFLGFACAYRLDLPLGPTEVVFAGLGLAAVALARLCGIGRST